MSEQQGSTTLTSLPAVLLEEVARHSLTGPLFRPGFFFHGLCSQTFLRVSRATRDASLRRASKIALDLRPSTTAASVQPVARLLSRACSLAPSLELKILSKLEEGDQRDRVVAAFLHASGQHGWQSVSKLNLQTMYFGPASCYLLGPAFPNLKTLELWGVELEQGGMLASLQTCTQLFHLNLRWCTIDKAAVPGSAVLLSRLPSLRELVLGGTTPEALAQGVTQLTSLFLHDSPTCEFDELCTFTLQFSQLQYLGISLDMYGIPCHTQHLRRLLLALTQLQSLELCSALDQQGLDAVLKHGKHLTRLTVREVLLTDTRASAASTLRGLEWEGLVSIEPWAYLPLHSMESLTISSLAFEEQHLPGKEWWLPVQCRGSSSGSLPSLMAQAASNILRCPAWAASGTGLTLGLITGEKTNEEDVDAQVVNEAALHSSSTRLGVIRALGPLMSRVSHFSIQMPGFTLGASEVAALGEVGGPHITHLTLEAADVSSDFWPSVWAHLPVLQTLTLAGCEGAVRGSVSEVELAMFCVRAPRPFTLELEEQMYKDLGGARMEDSCRRWATPQVTVDQVDQFGRPLRPPHALAQVPGCVH